MNDLEKIQVKIEVFFEIKDSEMFGGMGSKGYSTSSLIGNGHMLKNDFAEYVIEQKKYLAEAFGVPEEFVSVITSEQYHLYADKEEE